MNINPEPIWPLVSCQCNQKSNCICSSAEKSLRAWGGGTYKEPMNEEHREWCLKELDFVEGYNRKDYKNSTDVCLAIAVLGAWVDYCQDKGLM